MSLYLIFILEVPTSDDILMDLSKTLPKETLPHARSTSGESAIVNLSILAVMLRLNTYGTYS